MDFCTFEADGVGSLGEQEVELVVVMADEAEHGCFPEARRPSRVRVGE